MQEGCVGVQTVRYMYLNTCNKYNYLMPWLIFFLPIEVLVLESALIHIYLI